MRGRIAAWIGACLIVVGVACGVWFVGRKRPEPPVPPETAVSGKSAVVAPRSRDRYVGDDACTRCHADIAAHYRRSPMSRSWTAAASGVPADVALPDAVADPHSPFRYHVRNRNGRLVQEEVLDGHGTPHRLIGVADYFVGSGNHARAMVAVANGYLTQLPLGWFAHEGKWKLNPGYELKNHRFGRPILPGCLACHGGDAPHKSPTRNRYELPVTGGIRCEHCHGAGREHVAFHDDNAIPGKARDPIVNPKRLKPGRANDVCLQCHLQGDVVVYRAGADPFSFRPGETLADHRLDFLIQTEQPEALGVASHGARMMRSRCYTAGGGKLTCIHCHDPHRPVADFSTAVYDAKCAACHQPQSCRRTLRQNEVKDARGCVKCHMPRRKTREGQHLVFTDHWVRKPSQQPWNGSSPPLLQPDADVTLSPVWPRADPEGAQLGIAYVKLHASMGPQGPALARGVSLLERALAGGTRDARARFWLASGQIARYRSDAAVPLLKRLLQERPNWHEARFRLAVAYHQLKQYDEAIAEYERVIHATPDWMEPYPLVVRLHLSRRNAKAARRLLKQQLTFRPDATAYLSLALAAHLDGEPLAASLKAINSSLRLNPRNPTAYATRAYLFVQAGRKDDARRDYGTAIKIDPENREARNGLRSLGPAK